MKENTFEINIEDSKISSNDLDVSKFRILEMDGDNIIVQYGNEIFKTEILNFNPSSKTYSIRINTRILELQLNTELDLLIESMGMNDKGTEDLSTLIAPMPGLVLQVAVIKGQEVVQGDPLLILEAMKMENIIKSKANGIVKDIVVKSGDKVDKGQVLIEFES